MKLRRKKSPAAAARPPQPSPPPAAPPDPATLQLVVYPYPTLKKVAKNVAEFDAWLDAVIERMKDLMVQHKGVGLAAPQVGVPLRIFVASPSGKREEAVAFINPLLSDEQGEEEDEEGCLSLPDIRTNVLRFKSVRVEALDAAGQPFSVNAADFQARVIQHENDHLDGILLLDRMSPVAKLTHRKKIKELEAAGE